MAQGIDNRMSHLCGRFMSAAQNARETMEFALEDMEYIAEANPEREDIKACIAELKAKNKASEGENWAAANKWSEHFDGVSTDSDDADESDGSGADKD